MNPEISDSSPYSATPGNRRISEKKRRFPSRIWIKPSIQKSCLIASGTENPLIPKMGHLNP
ncbi:MAG: hypothetical protein VKL39_10335 [Leptolyngbyaceae bacterium]|nr:hypothetical protein [Leptolyngbyaceae bacterium]